MAQVRNADEQLKDAPKFGTQIEKENEIYHNEVIP